MKENSLILDGSYLLSKYTFGTRTLINSYNDDISAVTTFLKYVFHTILNYESHDIHLVFDIGRDVKKLKKYNKYKNHRVKVSHKKFRTKLSEDNYKKLATSREILIRLFGYTPIKCYTIPFIEGDTIIGYIDKREKELNKNTFVVSGDFDMFQLVDDSTTVVLPRIHKTREHEEIVTNKDLKKIWETLGNKKKIKITDNIKLKPRNVPYIKAISGDTNDGIPNISSIGDKFIEHLLKYIEKEQIEDFKDKDDFLKFLKESKEHVNERGYDRKVDKIFEDINHFEMNLSLIHIYDSAKELSPQSLMSIKEVYDSVPVFDRKGFVEYSYKLDLNCMDDFEDIFVLFESVEKKDFRYLENKTNNKWMDIVNIFNSISNF